MMKTVIESPTFRKQADEIWSGEDRLEFITFIAANPNSGTVIPNADGARKIRWKMKGSGKRGGARVIYFNLDEARIYLLAVYRKSEKATMTAKEIDEVR